MMKLNLEMYIEHIRKQINRIILFRVVFKTIIIIISGFHFYFFLRFLSKSPEQTYLLAIILRILSLSCILIIVYMDFNKKTNKFTIARWLDKLHRQNDDLYQNVIELKRQEKEKDNPITIVLEKEGIKRITSQAIQYPPILNKHILLLSITFFISIIIAWGLNIRNFPSSFKEYFFNKLNFSQQVNIIEVRPGNMIIGRNQDVLIEAINAIPNIQYKLFYKIDNKWREVVMSEGKHLFEKLDVSLSYFVAVGSIRSNLFYIEVLDNPTITEFSVTYNYPPYTKLPSEIDSNSYGNLIGIKYTKASISLKTNVPMSSAIMRFSDGTNLTLQPIGNKEYVTQLNITENKTWYLELIDILKRKNTPEEKTITVIPDNPPEIKIIEPGEDIVLNKNMTLPIRIIASDDFGLKNLILFQQKNEENSVSSDLQSVINNTNLDFDYIQSFLNFNLLPGDVVTYWAEIYDNSPDNQKAVSQKFKARFPSIEEIYREIEKQEQRKKDELAELLNKSKDLQKDFEQKRRELLKEEKLNWEDKKQLEDIVKKQQEFIKQIENLADNYQSLIDKLEQNEALSSETLQKMQKIQEIMQEINNEQLQQALKQFEKALQDLNPDAVKKAIENFKFSLEDFNKKIDNTLKLLESIRKEQAVQKALQISQEMEKMQQTLNEKTMDTKFSSEKLVEEQKQISEKLSSLNQQLDEIQKLLDQGKDKEAQNLLNEIKELAKDKDLDESLLDSQMKLSQNLRFQAQNSQKQALTKMKQMSRRLTDMKNLLGSSSQAEIMIAIQTAIRELLIFSQKHEEAASKFKQDPYLILSDLMATYEGIQLSINKLFSNPMVMMFTPPKFFSDTNQTYQGYRDFFLNVNEIQYYNLNNNLEAIQTGLNLMVYDLLLALNQSQSNGSAGSGMQSFMKMLQQMGEEQLAMNLLTQQLLQQMQQNGGRLGQAIQNQLQRLSEEQERLAENLKRTLQNNPEAQKQGNSLKQMVEEMDAVSRQLKQNKLDQNLINRQERILSKLLDAQKSINKREFSQKRKGETAEDKNYNSPSSQIDYNLLKKKALLDEQYRQFPKEYQKVIQQYLKNLVEVNH